MQSQGIGKILLNYAKDKRNKLYLNVYQKNARAISFYKREGFEIQHSGLDEATGERLCNDMATQIEIPVDISHILGNLITVIFDYQILLKPLKILSL